MLGMHWRTELIETYQEVQFAFSYTRPRRCQDPSQSARRKIPAQNHVLEFLGQDSSAKHCQLHLCQVFLSFNLSLNLLFDHRWVPHKHQTVCWLSLFSLQLLYVNLLLHRPSAQLKLSIGQAKASHSQCVLYFRHTLLQGNHFLLRYRLQKQEHQLNGFPIQQLIAQCALQVMG